jgi:putative DNA primase/helicase
MNLHTVARALAGVVNGTQVLAPGPYHSPHDRSLSVWIDPRSPDGFRVHSFAGDDWRVCRDHVLERLRFVNRHSCRNGPEGSLHGTAPQVANVHCVIKNRQSDDRDRIKQALSLWQEGLPIVDTIAELYLRHRGLFIAPEVQVTALRFHPACPFRLEDGAAARLPTLLGLMRDIITDEPKAIHRTALRADGSGKADLPGLGNAKKMLGPAKGAALKLTGDAEVIDGLGIAEGIESALTVICAGWRPVWACGSAGAIERFPILPGIESLTIFADADRTGMTAAAACQARWVDAGLECRILAPPQAGADWNDMVRADAA